MSPPGLTLDLILYCVPAKVMVPRKDYDTNRVVEGMLQMSKGTALLIDETGITQGAVLNERGVTNVKALSDMLQTGNVEYDFQFNKILIPVDILTLTLSTEKSLLPCVH